MKNRKEWINLISKEFFFEADFQNCRKVKSEAEGKRCHGKTICPETLDLEAGLKFKRWTECDDDMIDILM